MLRQFSVRSRVNFIAVMAIICCGGLLAIVVPSKRFADEQRHLAEEFFLAGEKVHAFETDLLTLNFHAERYLSRPDPASEAAFFELREKVATERRDIAYAFTDNEGAVRLEQVDHFVQTLNAALQERERIGVRESVGLEGTLRNAVHAVESRLSDFGDDELTVKMLMMRRHEKDFMMRLRPEYISQHDQRLAEFLRILEKRPYSDADKAELKDLLVSYHGGFRDWAEGRLALEEKVQSSRRDFLQLSDWLSDETAKSMAQAERVKAQLSTILTKISFFTLLFMTLFGAFCLSISWAVANSISQPLRQIADDMLALCEGRGREGHSFRGNSKNEITHLGNVLGFFRTTIQESDRLNAEVKYHRDHLEEEVHRQTCELSEKTVQLEHALGQEKELTELQNQFISIVSHEFRTPLTIIDAMARRVSKKLESMTPQEVLDRMENIRRATGRLSQMVEQTLDSSKIASGKLDFNPQRLDIVALTHEIVDRHREIAPEFEFRFEAPEAFLDIEADERLLDHVIANLVSNAIKYSQDNPLVIIGLKPHGQRIELTVRDHGVGIPKAEIPMITKRFFRASTSTGIKGTGIGLNLVAKLVELHQGRMNIESEQGQWTEFRVLLPVKQAEAEPDMSNVSPLKQRA